MCGQVHCLEAYLSVKTEVKLGRFYSHYGVTQCAQMFGGGYDVPGIRSICFDPRNHEYVAIGIGCAGGWLSDDGGASWRVSTRGCARIICHLTTPLILQFKTLVV